MPAYHPTTGSLLGKIFRKVFEFEPFKLIVRPADANVDLYFPEQRQIAKSGHERKFYLSSSKIIEFEDIIEGGAHFC